VLGLALVGAGLVGLGVGAAFAGFAQAKVDDSDAMGCTEASCPEPAADVRRDGRTAGIASLVAFGAGGLLTAGGVAVFLLAPGPEPRPQTGWTMGARLERAW
jgi:hypothetical protein